MNQFQILRKDVKTGKIEIVESFFSLHEAVYALTEYQLGDKNGYYSIQNNNNI